jgi:hypothetical protein
MSGAPGSQMKDFPLRNFFNTHAWLQQRRCKSAIGLAGGFASWHASCEVR